MNEGRREVANHSLQFPPTKPFSCHQPSLTPIMVCQIYTLVLIDDARSSQKEEKMVHERLNFCFQRTPTNYTSCQKYDFAYLAEANRAILFLRYNNSAIILTVRMIHHGIPSLPVHYCDLPCLFHVVNLLGQLYKYVVCNTMYVSRGYIALLGYIKQAQEIISTACSSALKKELGRFLQAPKQHRPKYILLLLPFNTAITLEMMAQIAKCVLDQSYCCSNIIAVDSLDSENITTI